MWILKMALARLKLIKYLLFWHKKLTILMPLMYYFFTIVFFDIRVLSLVIWVPILCLVQYISIACWVLNIYCIYIQMKLHGSMVKSVPLMIERLLVRFPGWVAFCFLGLNTSFSEVTHGKNLTLFQTDPAGFLQHFINFSFIHFEWET